MGQGYDSLAGCQILLGVYHAGVRMEIEHAINNAREDAVIEVANVANTALEEISHIAEESQDSIGQSAEEIRALAERTETALARFESLLTEHATRVVPEPAATEALEERIEALESHGDEVIESRPDVLELPEPVVRPVKEHWFHKLPRFI